MLPENTHTVVEDLLQAALHDALVEMHEAALVAWKAVLEERLAAEALHIRVLHPVARESRSSGFTCAS